MKIENSKIRKLGKFPVPQPPRKRFVAQTWPWKTPRRRDEDYRAYGPERVGFTPKGGNAGLGTTALVNKGAYILLSQ